MAFDGSKYVELPDWSESLRHLYWIIRVEGRIESKRRKYYRKVEKEKLRLAEAGIAQIKIAAVCRYLCNFKNASTLRKTLAEPDYQLALAFFCDLT
ncbi:hypothetical protein [Methylophilus sp.]|uniref:hypothetical protein n=1 Tax=Methylophilus sp. TaxID=29541 RepID=UPI004036AD32